MARADDQACSTHGTIVYFTYTWHANTKTRGGRGKPALAATTPGIKDACHAHVLCSAVFEKVITSGKWGIHIQPVPPKVHPVAPRAEVHGCSQFWERAGSDFPAFGVWFLGPRPADSGVWGHIARGSRAAQRATAASPAPLMAPAVPRALGHPSRPSPSLVWLRRIFWPPF